MIDTITDFLPATLKTIKFPWLIQFADRLKPVQGTVTVRILNKGSQGLKRLLNSGNLILINLVVLAYYAGKANAHSISEWLNVFLDFKVWLVYTIVGDLLYMFRRYFRDIFKKASKIVGTFILVVLLLLGIFWLFNKIFANKSASETVGE